MYRSARSSRSSVASTSSVVQASPQPVIQDAAQAQNTTSRTQDSRYTDDFNSSQESDGEPETSPSKPPAQTNLDPAASQEYSDAFESDGSPAVSPEKKMDNGSSSNSSTGSNPRWSKSRSARRSAASPLQSGMLTHQSEMIIDLIRA